MIQRFRETAWIMTDNSVEDDLSSFVPNDTENNSTFVVENILKHRVDADGKVSSTQCIY